METCKLCGSGIAYCVCRNAQRICDDWTKHPRHCHCLDPIPSKLQEDPAGIKFDDKKLQWYLLPLDEVEDIVKVLDHGAKKYSADNWQKVPEATRRYYSALMRHIKSWRGGEWLDPESGFPHLAHAGCCVLFLLWFGKKEQVKNAG